MDRKINIEFIKDAITDLIRLGIFDLNGKNFEEWCTRKKFIAAEIRHEIMEFKSIEEGQRFCVCLT